MGVACSINPYKLQQLTVEEHGRMAWASSVSRRPVSMARLLVVEIGCVWRPETWRQTAVPRLDATVASSTMTIKSKIRRPNHKLKLQPLRPRRNNNGFASKAPAFRPALRTAYNQRWSGLVALAAPCSPAHACQFFPTAPRYCFSPKVKSFACCSAQAAGH